jgi:predicted DNA-binding ArsR family transcriptional regulator
MFGAYHLSYTFVQPNKQKQHMDTYKIAYAIIESAHGWSVAEQFRDTFQELESFEEQNTNALNYIFETLKKLSNSDLLKTEAQEELDDYMDRLMQHLNNNC